MKTHRTSWPVKIGTALLAVIVMSMVVLPTATLASSTTRGYNGCNEGKAFAAGISVGLALAWQQRHHQHAPDNR